MFMERIQERLKLVYPDKIPWIPYFTEKDKQALLNWSNEDSKRVWHNLEYIIENYNFKGLSKYVDPFCLCHIEAFFCDDCEYGKNHGDCNKPDSDYDKIIKVFSHGTIPLHGILNCIFYNSLIREFELKEV